MNSQVWHAPSTVTFTKLSCIRHFGDKEVYTLDEAKAIQKRQYSSRVYRERMDRTEGYSKARMLEILADRCVYLTRRGATLINPHISPVYYSTFRELPVDPPEEAQRALRAAVREALGNPVPTSESDPGSGWRPRARATARAT